MVIQAGQFNTASDFGRTQFSVSIDDCIDELFEGDAELVPVLGGEGAGFEDVEAPLKESIWSARACRGCFCSS